tara:strand:+ start:3150 stop:4307 length:1158 start_codon:yes stop_codon:yes gene_type:complete
MNGVRKIFRHVKGSVCARDLAHNLAHNLVLGFTFCLALAGFTAPQANADEAGASLTRFIEINAQPVRWNPENRTDIKAGELEYSGGLELTSPDKAFGGWSGLAVSTDGAMLVAVSDEAHWLSAQIIYDEKGRLAGLADARMAPLRDLKGKPITSKNMGDAEGLAITGNDPSKGEAYVSFERHHRIWRYDLGHSGFDAVPSQIVTERRLGGMPANSGIEAIATLLPETGGDTQRLIALSEDGRNANGERKAFLIEGRKVERLTTKLDEPFKPTDIARLPNGDFLILERSYSPLAGPGMSLRQVPGSDVEAGAALEGRLLMRANHRNMIDNMEGLAVRAGDKGEVLVYVMSDDNYSPLQKTLLMMFRLKLAPAEGVLTLPHSPTKAE